MKIEAGKRGFEVYYEKSQNPDWREHYLPYDKFKGKLKEFVRRRARLKQLTVRTKRRRSTTGAYIVVKPGKNLDARLRDGEIDASPFSYMAPEVSPHRIDISLQDEPKPLDGSDESQLALRSDFNPRIATESFNELSPHSAHSPFDAKTTVSEFNPTKLQVDPFNGMDSYATTRYISFARSLSMKSDDGDKDLMRQLYETERSEFIDMLDNEVEKVHSFYKKHEQRLNAAMKTLDGRLAGHDDQRKDLVNGVLDLYSYVCVNLIALRQILIRYDMFLKTFSNGTVLSGLEEDSDFLNFGTSPKRPFTPSCLSQWYLTTRSNSAIGWNLADLLRHEGLIRLIGTLSAHLHELHFNAAMLKEQHVSSAGEGQSPENVPLSEIAMDVRRYTSSVQKFDEVLARTQESIEKVSFGYRGFKDRFVYSVRHYFLVGSIIDSLGLFEPQFLVLMRGTTFKKEMKVFADWRQTKDVFALTEDDGNWRQYIPFALNFISSVLYLMNYYIVEPSSTKYIEHLGGHDALVGVLIGAMSWAAFFSAVLYSIATNYNYKAPMLVSGVLISLGNLMYASAYSRGSLGLVFIGRALCGLGEPRVINRRFVADTIPSAIRTPASAAFAMGCAMGCALGPAVAILLDRLDWNFNLPFCGTIYVNGMTGPGYVMFVLWSVYTVLTFLYFEEPERIGIAEQEAMELAAARANEPKQTVVNPSRLLTSPGIDVERKLELADDKLEVESYDEDEDYAAALHDAPMTSKEDENVANSIISCFKAMTPAVYICMFLELVSKFSLEMLSSATSILTKNRYGWAVDEVGTLGSINGLMVIPVSIFVGFISQYYEDRALIMKLLIISLVGCLCLVDFSDFISLEGEHYNESHWLSVGPSHYVTGNLIFFSAIHAVESVNIALFSKVVPLSMAKGTFNCGLLATVVGTFGRSVGDMFIVAVGFKSLRNLMNMLYFPVSLIILGCIALVRFNYKLFAV